MSCEHDTFFMTEHETFHCSVCGDNFLTILRDLRAQLAAAQGRPEAMREALVASRVDQACDRTWCQLCRTEQRWPYNDADKAKHLHAVGCVLDRASADAPAASDGAVRLTCILCNQPIAKGSTVAGMGDGSGNVFAHIECYRVRAAKGET